MRTYMRSWLTFSLHILLPASFFFPAAFATPVVNLPLPRLPAVFGQPGLEQCDVKYGRPSYEACGVIIDSLGGRTLSLDNWRPYRFFSTLRDVIPGQTNIALPYTRTYRDCAVFIDTPEHMASAEPAQNQWDTSSWAEVKDKAEVVRERCVRGGGNGGSIPAGRAGRLRILLLGPDSSFLKDFARIHPGLMRARPGASTSNSFIQRVAAGFMMPTTDAGNAATVCHSNADCEQGSSCPVNENGGGGGGGGGGDGQDVDEETIYGRALGLAVAICAVMMKANGFGP